MPEPKPSDERNGCFLDSWWCCKVCDGEIPHGHTNDCDIWKLEKKLADARILLQHILKTGSEPRCCERDFNAKLRAWLS